ncbi:hypothetical protein M5D96_005554 [Drosophila gunungcola]|uniref:Uncharacterized protein n=1 Tax=Drosophila gunungcola TaxID=103775 RepID=A0A9P9YQH8_9MUSC|nr:hypothetical protein M5D96_005554 [Drosophila gunungcola]
MCVPQSPTIVIDIHIINSLPEFFKCMERDPL